MTKLLAAALIILLTGSLAHAQKPTASDWTVLEGAPTDACMGLMFGSNVRPDFTLVAVSDDARLSWAITVGQQGLDSIACSNSRSSVIGNAGPVKRHIAELAKKQLIEANDVLLDEAALKLDGPAKEGYRQELATKVAHIDHSLREMLHDETRLNPKFLQQPWSPSISIP